ncbi:BppU family phage baseplate upper protein [Leuconostoc mesenteroides]|uniref:BppU family phage baseplate upper protein n=4 Tax=Leuconostoc mesenteroides TaxID=1245 RepID=UPI002362FCC5|nr:BppU family phage baseplate upper protein [Leuconostoc mesenteroides]
MSNQYLSFDVTKQSAPQQLITGRQGDSQLKFVTMLFWDGDKNVPYDLTGKQVAFEALKPDNTHIVDYEGITVLDAPAGLVRYSFNAQVFAVAGTIQQAFFKITHTDSNKNVIADSTLEVAINILENRVESGIDSKDYLSEYDDLIAQVKKKFDDYAATVQDSIDKAQALHDQIVEYTNLINSNGVIKKTEFGDITQLKQPEGKTFIDKLKNELSQRGVNVIWFGAVGDGTTDDSAAIQSAINYVGIQGGGKVIFPPFRKFYVKSTINVQSNTEIDFGNSKIIWGGAVENNIGRFQGIFNSKGEILGESYEVNDVFLHIDSDSSDSTTYYSEDGYFTLRDSSHFNVGDYLLFKINTGSYSVNSLNPKDEKLVRITRIADNKIFVDYSSPYKYVDYDYTATIQKVKPVTNISFKNLNIIDEKIITSDKDVTHTHPDDLTFVSGISIQYGVDITFDRVCGFNTKLPVLFLNHLNRVTVSNGYIDFAAVVGPGEGYYTQFNYCNNIVFADSHAVNARHLVDFTGSSYAKVTKSSGRKMYSMTFQLHGAYEHHISYDNTSGTFNADSGTSFGNANSYISFINHQGWITSNGYTSNYYISDSDIKLIRAFTSIIVNSSKVLLDLGDQQNPPYIPDMRTDENKKMVFNQCDIDFMSVGQSAVIANYDEYEFNESALRAKKASKDLTIDGGMLIDFLNVKKIIFNRNKEISRLKIRIKSDVKTKINFDFFENDMSCSAATYHISAKNLTQSLLTARLFNNSFVNDYSESNNVDLMNLISADGNSDSIQNVIMIGNTIDRANLVSSRSNDNDAYISENNILRNCNRIIGADIKHQHVEDVVI